MARGLILKAPSGIGVSGPLLELANGLNLVRYLGATGILSAQDPPQSPGNNNVGSKVAQSERMPHDVPRPVGSAVQLCAQHRAAVPNADLHCVGDGTLGLARDIDGGPGEHECDGGEDAACGEEGAEVGDARTSDWIGVAKEDDVPDDSEGSGTHDEDGPAADSLGDDSEGEGSGKSKGVGGNCEELGNCGGVSEVVDNRRLSLAQLSVANSLGLPLHSREKERKYKVEG